MGVSCVHCDITIEHKKNGVSVEERKTIWNYILVSPQSLREIQAMEYIKKMDVAGIMRTRT